MTLKRIRTIAEAYKMIKEEDPDTAISKSYVRSIIPYLPGTIKRGNRWLIDYDELVEYLNDPERDEIDRNREYEQARNGIRPVGL